jgi:abequosyltransferase
MVTFTVAIPSYNRSSRLVAQLERLYPEAVALEGRCRLVVSDNCSTDDTQEAVTSWIAAHPDVAITYHRNASNLGVMRNIAACADAADGDFVWILGDDDEIPPGTVQRLLSELDAHPDLSLLSVNYEMFDVPNDRVMKPARLRLQHDIDKPGAGPLDARDDDGVPVVNVMGFMSGQVYRTEAIRRAIAAWPEFGNLDVQIFWSAHCAQQGPVLVKADPFIRYDCGTNALAKPAVWLKVHVQQSAEVFLKMRRIGYPVKMCRQGILLPVSSKYEITDTLKLTVRYPLIGIRALAYVAYAAVAVHLPVTHSA